MFTIMIWCILQLLSVIGVSFALAENIVVALFKVPVLSIARASLLILLVVFVLISYVIWFYGLSPALLHA